MGTPIDLSRLLTVRQPIVRARYELQEIGHPDLRDVLVPILQRIETRRAAHLATAG